MRNKETGEFELVIGDRQLLSGFFIVVVLLAVVFMMGYVVGQNSPRSAKTDTAALTPPAPAETRPPSASPLSAAAPPPAEPAASDASQPAVADAPPQPTTQPAREAAPASPPPAPATPPAAPPGAYWQVGAWKDPADAQDLLQTLKEGGMPAYMRVDADKLAHLVVGPYSDAASKAKAKGVLESRFGLHPIPK